MLASDPSEVSRRVTFRDELHLLQTQHQRSSALHLIHLPAPVDRLLDDVSKIVIVLRTEAEMFIFHFTLLNSTPPSAGAVFSLTLGLLRRDQTSQQQRDELMTAADVPGRRVCWFRFVN